MVRDLLQKSPDGGQEGLHIKPGVKHHHICNETEKDRVETGLNNLRKMYLKESEQAAWC